ncbi:MAG: hypothetical protein H0U53_00825 [Actinobacteria bacterium]|nr:hypothetical protein [Actinomycetota bacterium]
MKKSRKFLAVISLFSALALAAPPVAMAGGDNKKCAPGLHGNPHPGFKPGSC